jgi:hypothetical protein
MPAARWMRHPRGSWDMSSTVGFKQGVRAAVRRPVRRHLLTDAGQTRVRASVRASVVQRPRAARARSLTGKDGRRSSERILSFSCFNSLRH